jgi:hypothetical protein
MALTVADLAAAKRLDADYLTGVWGLTDGKRGVEIPYYHRDGSPADALRYRSSLTGGWSWRRGSKLLPYGLQRLTPDDRRAVIVEGESDLWTLDSHGIRAIGIPGASNVDCLKAMHLAGLDYLYVSQEADAAGAEFVRAVATRLDDIGFLGALYVVTFSDDAKDPSDLYLIDPPTFVARMVARLQSARNAGDVRAKLRPGQIAPDTLPDVEPFPVDVFPPILAEYVASVARAMPCPVDYVALPLLAACGSLLGDRRILRAGLDWKSAPNVWVVIIGQTGALKTPAMQAGLKFLFDVQRRAINSHDREMAAWRDACAGLKRNDPRPAKPEVRHLLTSDHTLEQLMRMLKRGPILLYRDELIGLITSMNQYRGGKGSDRQALLSAWAGAPVKIDRRGADGQGEMVYIERPILSIVGAMPVDSLDQLIDRENRSDGFIERFLFAYPNPVPRRYTGRDLDADVITGCAELFADLARLEFVECGFGHQARELWRDWHDANAMETECEDIPEFLRGFGAKAYGHLLRIVLILHTLNYPSAEIITRDTLADAIRVIDWAKSHWRRVAWAIEQRRHEGKNQMTINLEKRITTLLDAKQAVTLTELQRHLSNNVAANDLKASLAALEALGAIQITDQKPSGKRGRPTRIVHTPDWLGDPNAALIGADA